MRIIILGPTASGKTELSIQLSEELNTSIISADSRQCYKHIDIGTAKPSQSELERIPHYNISVLELEEEDSAMEFQKRAAKWEKEIHQESDHVIYVGGSTLHIQSLIMPFNEMPEADEVNITKLEKRIEKEGLDSLHKILKEIDPEYAKKMDGLNRQRIIRALDVWMQTGKPFSHFHNDKPFEQPENMSVLAMHWPRKMLHERIEERCDEMLDNGLIDETRELLESGYSADLQALQTVGYRQVIQYLNDEISREQMEKDFKTATRRYAKRQITWLRRWPFLNWLNCSENSHGDLLETIQQQVAADMNKG